MISKSSDHEKFKEEFLNKDFESLNVSATEPDWNIQILQAMSFKDFQDCKALLHMLEDKDYEIKYKYYLESAFNNMIHYKKNAIQWHTKGATKSHISATKDRLSNERHTKKVPLEVVTLKPLSGTFLECHYKLLGF
ncbi:hypothetical protein Hanom_Chr03g00195671 [Helianthus anomalus]